MEHFHSTITPLAMNLFETSISSRRCTDESEMAKVNATTITIDGRMKRRHAAGLRPIERSSGPVIIIVLMRSAIANIYASANAVALIFIAC